MLRFTKQMDYGLMAMQYIALHQGEAAVGVKRIADEFGIPVELLAKVLQRLARTELLVSTQGTRGGYTLSRPSQAISVAEVIQAIDGPFTVTACSTENSDCDQYHKCSVRDHLWQIRDRIVAALDRVTLAEMAAEPNSAPAPVSVVRRA